MVTDALMLAPGWFGKVPGSGDFAHRRLTTAFLVRWDAWLQHEMLAMRQRYPNWVEHYLTAPVWSFVLAPGLVEVRGAMGIFMPSVDRVGRYFPLTMLGWLDDKGSADGEGLDGSAARRWWTLATDAALRGLEADLDADRFDDMVRQLFASVGAEGPLSNLMPQSHPGTGQSQWSSGRDEEQQRCFKCNGLPAGQGFDALFDLAAVPLSTVG